MAAEGVLTLALTLTLTLALTLTVTLTLTLTLTLTQTQGGREPCGERRGGVPGLPSEHRGARARDEHAAHPRPPVPAAL